MMRYFSFVFAAFLFFSPFFVWAGDHGGGHDAPAAAPSGDHGGGGHGAAEPDDPALADVPYFVNLPPMTVPVIQSGRTKRFTTYNIVLQVKKDKEKLALVNKKMPKIQDAVFTYLHGIGNTRAAQKMNNLQFVKESLLQVVERVTGPDVMEEILVTSSFNKQFPE